MRLHPISLKLPPFLVKPICPEFEQNYGDLLGFLQTDQGRAMAYGVPNGIEAAYQVIKSQKLASLTPETVLQDPNWRQKILENPEVKNAILQQYGQQVQAGQPPVVISGGQASNIPTSPVPDIKSTDDAKAASVPFFANILKRKGGTS